MSAHDALFRAHACFVEEEYAEAIEHYTAAIELAPKDADAYSKRAAAHLKLGHHAEALADASASVRIEPSARAFRRMGVACFAMGEFISAKPAFANALELCDAAATRELKRWLRKCEAELASSAAPTPTLATAPTAATVPPAAAAPPTAAAPPPPLDPAKIRHEWYQTETHVIVSVLAKRLAADAVAVTYDARSAHVKIDLGEGAEYELALRLFAAIEPEQCKHSVGTAKARVITTMGWQRGMVRERTRGRRESSGSLGLAGSRRAAHARVDARRWSSS